MTSLAAGRTPEPLTETQLFRIGPGYVEYWMHEVTHWNVETRHHTVAIELGEAFMRLIAKRDAVENARRAFIPVSSLPTDELPSDTVQKALFDATHDFFQTYYSTLSAFAELLNEISERARRCPAWIEHEAPCLARETFAVDFRIDARTWVGQAVSCTYRSSGATPTFHLGYRGQARRGADFLARTGELFWGNPRRSYANCSRRGGTSGRSHLGIPCP